MWSLKKDNWSQTPKFQEDFLKNVIVSANFIPWFKTFFVFLKSKPPMINLPSNFPIAAF